MYTGILALGVGDALASIVGKRVGRHRWSASSSKTVEGSVAFAVSVIACAWVMRVLGLTEQFSVCVSVESGCRADADGMDLDDTIRGCYGVVIDVGGTVGAER